MKNFISSVVILFALLWAEKVNAQTFTIQKDTVWATVNGNEIVKDKITNTTAPKGVGLRLNWKVKSSDFPADWLTSGAFGICDNITCYGNTDDTMLWNRVKAIGQTYTTDTYSLSVPGTYELNLNFSMASAGKHYVTITITDPAATPVYDTDMTFIITRWPAAVSNIGASTNQITLFPNPAQQSTALSVTLSRAGEIQVNVTDMQGRIVKSVSKEGIAGTQKIEIGTNDLAAGLYLIQVQADGQISNEKLSVIK